ncbi:unnamed protein product [Durusdinium trenchii]|uniref:U3 small nucleolar RNA-associated protein 13 C-terminal domain-containing protein n=1 Tax=Durusdinium trenchii TaxID=1381693 RepID=A0ABP0K2F0_9DINO
MATAASSLSEAWAVDARHVGCFTGGKVAFCESSNLLGCLCDEELHLVDSSCKEPTRRVVQEGDGVLTFAIDHLGLNACTSHRSGLLRHFTLGEKIALARSWRGHEQVVADVSFDATGALVATGSVDRTAKVWDFQGYFCTHNFKGHAGIVSLARFHPAKLQLVTIADTEVRLWDLESSQCIGIMKDHLASISSMCFGRVKTQLFELVTGGRDQVVNVWNLQGKCSLVRSIPVFEHVEGVMAVPTRHLRQQCKEHTIFRGPFADWMRQEKEPPAFIIFTVGNKGAIRAWNPLDGKQVASHDSPHAAKGELRQIHCLDTAKGTKMVTIGEDLNFMMWSLPEFEVFSHIMGHNEEIVHVQLIPQIAWPQEQEVEDSTTKGSLVTADRFVCIANDEHPRVVSCEGFGAAMLRGHTDVVISCDVSVDGAWIATGGKDQVIKVWSASTCELACTCSGHAGDVTALSFSKRRPRTLRAASQQEQLPMLLVSVSQDKTMKVWEIPSAKELGKVLGTGTKVKKSKVTVLAHSKEVNDVLVAPNNKLMASGGQDKLVRIWKFPEGDLLGECKGHRRGIWCVAFSPIDQVVASASGDATVRLWNLKDFRAIRSFQGHSSAVLRVAFLSNGMQLMTSSVDGLLKLWHIRTAECAGTFEEHSSKVWCIDVCGNRMVSGGADSKICIWRDTTQEMEKQRQDEKADLALKDSRIALLVREGKVEAALTLALDLKRPGQMRQILLDHTMDVVGRKMFTGDGDKAEPESQRGQRKRNKAKRATPKAKENGVCAKDKEESTPIDLRRWVLSLNVEQLERLVELLEQWNSNRRMAPLAQMTFATLLLSVTATTTTPSRVPASKLKALEGMNATCRAVLSYASRHMARVESLLQKTYLFDLILQGSSQGLATKDSDDATISAEALKRTMDVLLQGKDEDLEKKEDEFEETEDDAVDEDTGSEDEKDKDVATSGEAKRRRKQ